MEELHGDALHRMMCPGLWAGLLASATAPLPWPHRSDLWEESDRETWRAAADWNACATMCQEELWKEGADAICMMSLDGS